MLQGEIGQVLNKNRNGLENCILGLIASILPPDNVIASKLNETSKSNYFFQTTIKTGHQRFKKLRVFEIPCCSKGCCAFIGQNQSCTECPICDRENIKEVNETIYYFPLVDRLVSILRSDLCKFLNYSNLRPMPEDGCVEDVYDGSVWKEFVTLLNEGEVFIGINFCWDGADMFEFSGKQIWPLSISILNFPKDLRDKLNIGLHVIAMCSGLYYRLHIYCTDFAWCLHTDYIVIALFLHGVYIKIT